MFYYNITIVEDFVFDCYFVVAHYKGYFLGYLVATYTRTLNDTILNTNDFFYCHVKFGEILRFFKGN